MPSHGTRKGRGKGNEKLCRRSGKGKAFRKVGENYDNPRDEAWLRESTGKLSKEVVEVDVRKVKENYAKRERDVAEEK